MAPKDNKIIDKIIELLRYSWYSVENDAWSHPQYKGYKWVPKVIYLTTLANKDAIVISDINYVNIILDLLTNHVVYCTPDALTRYGNICNKVVDKIPDDVFTIALPP